MHSLCTVISMKMEVPEAAWVNDLDGFALADSINSHLSPFIRVFGIVPVTRCCECFHTVPLNPCCKSITHCCCNLFSTMIFSEVFLFSWGCALCKNLKDHWYLAYYLGVRYHEGRQVKRYGLLLCRSFRARHNCCTRTYDYLLPAAIIGIHPDTDPSEVEQRVKKFRSLLHLFEVFTLVLPLSRSSCNLVVKC